MAYSWLHEGVCRQRHELWMDVGYMKLCVVRDMNWADSCLHEALFRQKH